MSTTGQCIRWYSKPECVAPSVDNWKIYNQFIACSSNTKKTLSVPIELMNNAYVETCSDRSIKDYWLLVCINKSHEMVIDDNSQSSDWLSHLTQWDPLRCYAISIIAYLSCDGPGWLWDISFSVQSCMAYVTENQCSFLNSPPRARLSHEPTGIYLLEFMDRITQFCLSNLPNLIIYLFLPETSEHPVALHLSSIRRVHLVQLCALRPSMGSNPDEVKDFS